MERIGITFCPKVQLFVYIFAEIQLFVYFSPKFSWLFTFYQDSSVYLPFNKTWISELKNEFYHKVLLRIEANP